MWVVAVRVRDLVGRQGELARLAGWIDAAAGGRGAFVLLGGEAGIGKTTCTEEAARLAADAGFSVAWGRCWHGAVAEPYWPWQQALSALSLPVPTPDEPATARPPQGRLARLRLFEQVAASLHRAAAHRPLFIALEDIHWADPASLLLLSFLAPGVHAAAIFVVATYREHELPLAPGNPVTSDLLRHAETLRLGGMSLAEVAELVTLVQGSPAPGAVAAALHVRSGGNPLYVRELARLPASGTQRPGLPVTLGTLLLSRVAKLSPGCRSVLEAAAVVGDTFPIDAVAAMTDGVPAGLDEAERAGLITTRPTVASFAHALVREAVYESLPASARARLHERALGALEGLRASRPVDAGELAGHALRAGSDAGTVARYHLAAGEQAMERLAFEDAVAFLEVARDHSGENPQVLSVLGQARLAVGDFGGSRSAYEALAAVARATGRLDLLAQAALGMGSGPAGFEVGWLDQDQIRLLEEALEALGPQPSPLRVSLLARLSVAIFQSAPEARRRGLAEDAVALGREVGDPASLAYALAAHCDAVAGPSGVTTRLQASEEVLTLALRIGDPELELLGRRLRVVALLELGRLPEVDAEIEAYARSEAARCQPLFGWYVPMWRAMRALLRGDLPSCRAHAEQMAQIGGESENAGLHSITLRWCLACETLDLEDLAALLREHDLSTVPGVWPLIGLALSLAVLGRPEEARSRLDAAAALLPDAPRDSEWLPMLAQAVELIALIGTHPVAGWLFDELSAYRHLTVVEGAGAMVRGSVDRYLAILSVVLGRPEDAAAHFEAALAAAARMDATLLEARILRDWGLLLEEPERVRAARRRYADLGITARVAELDVTPAPPDHRGPVPASFRREGKPRRPAPAISVRSSMRRHGSPTAAASGTSMRTSPMRSPWATTSAPPAAEWSGTASWRGSPPRTDWPESPAALGIPPSGRVPRSPPASGMR